MGIVETIFQSATVLVALAGAYVVAFWFVLIVWTYRDIESRSASVVTQVFSTLLVVLFFVPGVLLYLILRPKETLDQAFQRSLEEEYLLQDLEELPLCPSCHRYDEARTAMLSCARDARPAIGWSTYGGRFAPTAPPSRGVGCGWWSRRRFRPPGGSRPNVGAVDWWRRRPNRFP